MQRDLTDITILLDRSGSMEMIRGDMLGAINAFIADQKKLPGRAKFSFYRFDTQYEHVRVGQDLATTSPITPEEFVPRGGTALLDAMGRCINDTGDRLAAMPEADRPGKVLFVVVTDGEENSSREFNNQTILAKVKLQTETYSWAFVYLGANQDAFAVARSMGFAPSNTMQYASTAGSVQTASANLLSAAGRYRSTEKAATNDFFEVGERHA